MLPHNREKLLPLDTCRDVLGALQAEGKRVVLCHVAGFVDSVTV